MSSLEAVGWVGSSVYTVSVVPIMEWPSQGTMNRTRTVVGGRRTSALPPSGRSSDRPSGGCPCLQRTSSASPVRRYRAAANAPVAAMTVVASSVKVSPVATSSTSIENGYPSRGWTITTLMPPAAVAP